MEHKFHTHRLILSGFARTDRGVCAVFVRGVARALLNIPSDACLKNDKFDNLHTAGLYFDNAA
jgi:hypothetical protein